MKTSYPHIHYCAVNIITFENNSSYDFPSEVQDDYKQRFTNVARLYGGDIDVTLNRLKSANIMIIGLGGVGSWVVEALARSGINRFVLIDMDDVCISNINRQLPALSSTIGKFKGDVLKSRILDINPCANVTFLVDFVRPNNIETIFASLDPIDYVVDCADGVTDKAAIVDYCVQRSIPIVVSGGAGGVTDPTLIRISDMARSIGDTLIMRVRKKLRQEYGYPEGKQTNAQGNKIDKKWNIPVVHSLPIGSGRRSENPDGSSVSSSSRKCDAVYGNTCFSTGTLGFALASVVVNSIAKGQCIPPKRLGFMKKEFPSVSNLMTEDSTTSSGKSGNDVTIQDTSNTLPSIQGNNTQCGCEVNSNRSVPTAVNTPAIDLEAIYQYLNTSSAQYFDSHCHLQLHPAYNKDDMRHIQTILHHAVVNGVMNMSVCGTCPGEDWKNVETLYTQYSEHIIPHFGLHPWWIARYLQCTEGLNEPNSNSSWECELERLLQIYPLAGVGECGLDKNIRKDVTEDQQVAILLSHIRLAATYHRPLTLHCVGMWGTLLSILSQHSISKTLSESPKVPKCYILHSCNSMPVEMVSAFDKIGNVYFSLSAGRYENPKFLKLLRQLPRKKLLLETDSPDQLPSVLRQTSGVILNEPANVRIECFMLSQALGMEHEELARLSRENAFNAYCFT